MTRKLPLAFALLAAGWAMAQQTAGPKPTPDRPLPSGAALYRNYCESCHGANGKGGGTKAEQAGMKLPDLTRLTERAGGEFPVYRLRRLLGGEGISGSHGSTKMPVWGSGLGGGKPDSAEGLQRIDRVVEHLRSLQAKPALR